MKAAVRTAKREEAHIQVILAAAESAGVVVAFPSADSVLDGSSSPSVVVEVSVGSASPEVGVGAPEVLSTEKVEDGVLTMAVAEAATQ